MCLSVLDALLTALLMASSMLVSDVPTSSMTR